MKKTTLIKMLASASLLTSLTACSSGTSAAPAADSVSPLTFDTSSLAKPELDLSNADGVLKNVLDKGVLVVATSPDNPPYEYVGGKDSTTVTGSEMYLAKYIADTLGVQLQIETMDFNAVLTAVDTGKADLAMAGFGWKKDREENYELSHGYSRSGSGASCHGLLIPADQMETYKTLDDFAGKHVMAQASSLQQMYVEDEIKDVELELVSSIDQEILALNSAKADAVALPCDVAKQYAKASNGALEKSTVEFDLTPYQQYAGNVIAAKKGETSMIDAINVIVEKVNGDDLYQGLYEKALAEAGMTEVE